MPHCTDTSRYQFKHTIWFEAFQFTELFVNIVNSLWWSVATHRLRCWERNINSIQYSWLQVYAYFDNICMSVTFVSRYVSIHSFYFKRINSIKSTYFEMLTIYTRCEYKMLFLFTIFFISTLYSTHSPMGIYYIQFSWIR